MGIEDASAATCRSSTADTGAAGGRRADRIARQFAASIERLGRVDLYLTHFLDPDTPIEETLHAFAAARADGRIRAFGVCNVSVAQLEVLLSAADNAGRRGTAGCRTGSTCSTVRIRPACFPW